MHLMITELSLSTCRCGPRTLAELVRFSPLRPRSEFSQVVSFVLKANPYLDLISQAIVRELDRQNPDTETR
jgi:hypothetical protein